MSEYIIAGFERIIYYIYNNIAYMYRRNRDVISYMVLYIIYIIIRFRIGVQNDFVHRRTARFTQYTRNTFCPN